MYDRKLTEASKGALLELCMALNEYRGEFVLAGGWSPYFLTIGHFDHCGSVDIDFVLRPRVVRRYEGIRDIVERLGYRQTSNPFRFERRIPTIDGTQQFDIALDFLTEPEAAMEMKLVDVQQDLRAFFVRGSSVVFSFNYEQRLEAVLPSDGPASTTIDVADVVGSITMKGLALLRLKDKDSYDIYAVAGFHGGSPLKAAEAFRRIISARGGSSNSVIQEALRNIKGGFSHPASYGCAAVARFIGSDGMLSNDAHQRVTGFLDEVSRE